MARVNRYGVRAPIGKRSTPLPMPEGLDYDLWLGPAQDKPIFRDNLQYDWHWDWNTGSGEMGNWGVHVLDDLRNNVILDKVALPTDLLSRKKTIPPCGLFSGHRLGYPGSRLGEIPHKTTLLSSG